MGMGNGQSSLPTIRNARLRDFGSMDTLIFSRAFAAKSAARCRSCAYSPVSTMSSPAGPNSSMSRPASNGSAAATSAPAACCGEPKVRAPADVPAEAALAGTCEAASGTIVRLTNTAAPTIHGRVGTVRIAGAGLMVSAPCNLPVVVRCRCPPPFSPTGARRRRRLSSVRRRRPVNRLRPSNRHH